MPLKREDLRVRLQDGFERLYANSLRAANANSELCKLTSVARCSQCIAQVFHIRFHCHLVL